MEQSLELSIKERFPRFFRKMYKGSKECVWHTFDIKDDWAPLLVEIAELAPDDVFCVQVKEKFGTMRVYCNTDTMNFFGQLRRFSEQIDEITAKAK